LLFENTLYVIKHIMLCDQREPLRNCFMYPSLIAHTSFINAVPLCFFAYIAYGNVSLIRYNILVSISTRKRGCGVRWRGGQTKWERDWFSRSGILLSTRTRNTRNIIDVCASRACRVIGRRKLTCERPGNIARIKKPERNRGEARERRTVGRGAKIKIGGCAFALFFSISLWFLCFRPSLRITSVFVREITSIIHIARFSYLRAWNTRQEFF